MKEKKKREKEEEKRRQLELMDPYKEKREQIMAVVRNFTGINRKDDYRTPDAYKDGGFGLTDPVILGKYRSAAKEIIKKVGR